MSSEVKSPLEALKALEACKGEKLTRQLLALQTVSRIVRLNARELREAMSDLNRPEIFIHLWKEENRELLNEYHCEAVRLFHNFLASVGTFRDHTQAFVARNYTAQPFAEEYSKRATEVFGGNSLAAFVIGLRNFILHRALPATNAQLTGQHPRDGGRVESTIRLNLEELKSWDKWTAQARRHLESYTSDPPLAQIVGDYEPLLTDFYHWFDTRIQRMHATDFEEAEKLHQEMTEAWPRRSG